MQKNAAQTSLWKTSDAIIGGVLLIGLALDYIFPLSLANYISATIRVVAGGLMILMGLLIVVFAKVQFARAKQPSAPGKPTTDLVKDGLFRYTRNPLYLGLTILLAGFSLSFNIVWWAALTLPAMGLMQWALILPEERYLAEKFGDEYFKYAARVRRWL